MISLWLNPVFAHGGGDERRRHSRVDFDKYVSECGHAPLEYAFRNVVWSLGLQYISLKTNTARPALETWERQFSSKPSFNIGAAFGVSTRERTKEGHIIVRRASSEYATDETFDQRLRRILDRGKFDNLHFILKNVELGDHNLVRLILKATDFSAMASVLDYEIRIVENLGDTASEYGNEFRGSSGLSWAGRHSRLFLFELYMVTEPAGLEILNGQLNTLKEVLISG